MKNMKCMKTNLVYLEVKKRPQTCFLFNMVIQMNISFHLCSRKCYIILEIMPLIKILHCVYRILLQTEKQRIQYLKTLIICCVYLSFSSLDDFRGLFLYRVIREANRSPAPEFLFVLLLSNEFYCTAGVKSYWVFCNRV